MVLLLYLLSTLMGVLVGGCLLGSMTFIYFRDRADSVRSPWAGVAVLYLTLYAVGIGGLGGIMGGFLVWYSVN